MTRTTTTTGATTMKTSDLIARLQALMAAHGDLPVYVHDPMAGFSPFGGDAGAVRVDELGAVVLDLEAGCGDEE